MTKAEIVKEVSKSTGIENATVSAVVEGFMATVKGALAKEERGIWSSSHITGKSTGSIGKPLLPSFFNIRPSI